MLPPPHANPEMIVLARECRGWTQTELAAAVGVGQSTVAKWEMGAITVNSDELDRLAAALGFDREFFAQSDPRQALGASLNYRQRSNVPVKLQRRIEAELNIRKMQAMRLLRAADIGEHHFPSRPVDGIRDAAEAARELRGTWRVPDGPIRDLTAVVEAAGGLVIQVDFGTKLIDGASLRVPGLPPLFFMNPHVPGERYRFSLAHELGHAVMHVASPAGEVEDEANAFASEFLLPRERVRPDLRDLTLDNARRLKPFWGVSMQCLISRAFELRLIPDSRRRRLFTMLSAQGQRTQEPWPLPVEQPRTWGRLIEFHRCDLGIGEAELRRVLFTASLGPTPPGHPVPKLRLVGLPTLFSDPDANEPSPPS